MPYTAPTPAELQARYPAFASVAEATIQVWLTDSERYVDTSWIEGDYQPAIMAHAAHQMALLSLGTQSASGAIPAGMTRWKSGVVDVTISEAAASQSAKGGYSATVYGREYLMLRRRSFAGPRIVAAGTLPTCGYPTTLP